MTEDANKASHPPFKPLYHVPRSQVWEGSGGRQAGKVHLHVREQFDFGRIHRSPGRALCGRDGWYERDPEMNEPVCPRCLDIARRFKAARTTT